MKLTIVGGGGFRVPLVYGALLERAERLGLDEVVLHDVEAGRLERIGHVLEGLAEEHGQRLPFRTTTDLVEAVEGADYVFCAIRVGQLEGRVVDEDVPLGLGVLGQETTGPGGICFALRTIPVMVRLAEVIKQHAPHAWLINFTNPAGMVTEAVQQVLGDRAIGICDSPRGLCARVAGALGRDPAELWFDYFGLNHLGWLRGVRDAAGDSLLDRVLEDDARLEGFEEGRLFGGEWLRALGMIPNEYLYYFYYAADTVSAIRSGPHSRGAFLLSQQRDFYAQNGQPPADALAAWRATRYDRERTYMAEARSAAGDPSEHEDAGNGGYESEAMAVLEAIALNTRAVLILNTANRSSLPFLDERAVVEVPCVVGRAGPVPVAMGGVPAHARALVETMKDVERTTIDAALIGSRELAVRALALHPLVPSVRVAREIFDGYRKRLPALQEAFPRMNGVDVACADPVFLDLTFAGLEAIPLPGEERLAQDFLRSPGGGAITAVGAARLGLSTALVSPLGEDPPGMLVRALLAEDGVRCKGRTVARTPVTVIMPADGDRAMVTFDPGEGASAAEIAGVEPRAVVLSLPRLAFAPASARVYATVGDVDARALAGGALPDLSGARAVFVNAREAQMLTGASDPESAAAQLAEHAPVAVVTLGEDGALAAGAEGAVRVGGVRVDAVDTTGAGDLFSAAYVWADHWGAPLEERLRWAVLYAALSVRVATAVAGAVTLRALLEEGAEHGLASPVRQSPVAMKEEQ